MTGTIIIMKTSIFLMTMKKRIRLWSPSKGLGLVLMAAISRSRSQGSAKRNPQKKR